MQKQQCQFAELSTVQTDNSTACGVVNNKIQPKATKAMDMRFYWLKDREENKQFKIYWRKGALNRGDYVTNTILPSITKPFAPHY
jgi:hypothetical protein